MLSVILVEPETPGNIGSVARVMRNFGFSRLVLVNPKCDHLDGEAYGRAMHASDILKKALVVKSIPRLGCLVATSSVLGSDYNVLRSPISPSQLASQLSGRKGSIGLVFGRESSGLTSSEIASCDILVTIPSSPKYPALNLSHAVSIVLYELFSSSLRVKSNSHIPLASSSERNLALSMARDIINALDYAVPVKKKTQNLVWSRLVSKSFLSRREMYALLGFLRKVKERLR